MEKPIFSSKKIDIENKKIFCISNSSHCEETAMILIEGKLNNILIEAPSCLNQKCIIKIEKIILEILKRGGKND